MTFLESDLQFEFVAAHWQIKKYDTHRYFKILSGAGLKGVDFLGILEGERVVFFEVKNFHTNHHTKAPVYQIFEDPPTFVQQVADKMEDTITSVNVIIKYLERKRWYRFFLKWRFFLPKILIANRDWYFWHQVYHIGKQKENRIFVLWLEIDFQNKTNTKEKIVEELGKQLEKELFGFVDSLIIANQVNPVFHKILTVSPTS